MNRSLLPALLAGALLSLATLDPGSAALAHTVEAGDLLLIHPASRPNLPNRPAVVYVTIANDGAGPDRLIAAGSPAFASAEFHRSAMEGGVMTMKPVEAIDLPAGETVELAPGGYHIMLFGGATLYKPGDLFPLVLTFERAGEVAIDVLVEPIDPSRRGHGQMGHPQPSN
jgi:hypothetical protein